MGSYRYETAYVSGYIIDMLMRSSALGRMKHNGGDIILFETPRAEQVSIHLIDSGLPLYEIRKTLTDNGKRDIYTLFVLWADMMLPHHGQIYTADDWMEGLYTLYNGCIYAYEFLDRESYVFPIYFRGNTPTRTAEFGTTVRFRNLTCRTVTTHLPGLNDSWRVADFAGVRGTAHDPKGAAVIHTALQEHYVLLGVTADDDREAIKKAYRHLARAYHPDLNKSAEAHGKMQQLNKAYQEILKSLGDVS
jgi:hypothetical protein